MTGICSQMRILFVCSSSRVRSMNLHCKTEKFLRKFCWTWIQTLLAVLKYQLTVQFAKGCQVKLRSPLPLLLMHLVYFWINSVGHGCRLSSWRGTTCMASTWGSCVWWRHSSRRLFPCSMLSCQTHRCLLLTNRHCSNKHCQRYLRLVAACKLT